MMWLLAVVAMTKLHRVRSLIRQAQFAGPVSKLLEHLRNKAPAQAAAAAEDRSTLDAFSSAGTAQEAARTAARSAKAEAEAAAAQDEVGVSRRCGGQSLDLSGRQLEEVPGDVWVAGAVVFFVCRACRRTVCCIEPSLSGLAAHVTV
jgi:hypothetical protein